ncbi:RNA helicase, partial [Azospirillum formosense]|nr:RNA helicase [Azospirillum formosense]
CPPALGPPVAPRLVHELPGAPPAVVTAAAPVVTRVAHGEGLGLVPLGLPLPKGKRALLVPAERREAVLLEIHGTLDRARRRNALLAQGRRALEGWSTSLHPADDRTRVRAVRGDDLPWPGLPAPVRLQVSRVLDAMELADLTDDDLALRLEGDPALAAALEEALSRTAARLHRYAGEAEGADDAWTFASLADRLSR